MITTAQLHRLAQREGLRFDQIEKDYVILWVLSGLVRTGAKGQGWVFKGGTCLRHCYYEGYRFSEDIDFSCRPKAANVDVSLNLLHTVAERVWNESGIRLSVREPLTAPGDFQLEIPLEYSRGGAKRQGLPQVKVHLTFDEPILDKTALRTVKPCYDDLPSFKVPVYSKREILAEKLRSLLQQQMKWPRPRDLYDLWYIICKSGEPFSWQELKPIFEEKCRVRKVSPDVKSLTSEALRKWNEKAWADRLGPMLKDLPDFERVWKEWILTFQELLKH